MARAAASAWSVESDAVSLMVPWNAGGRPSISASQPRTCSSSSVAAGDERQTMAFTFSAAASISPRIPGADPVMAK